MKPGDVAEAEAGVGGVVPLGEAGVGGVVLFSEGGVAGEGGGMSNLSQTI